MQKIDIFELVNVLITIGVVLILLGTTIELEKATKNNQEKDIQIKKLTLELEKCRR